MSLDGNSLIYSSYLGGSNDEVADGIAVDATHGAWIVGTTRSADFPIRGGPIPGQQRKFGGDVDAFLIRVAPDGLSVTFSTFAGGPNADLGYDVAVDRTGAVYATGDGGLGFPITPGMKPCSSFAGSRGGAFVIRRKSVATQAQRIYSTCLPAAVGYGIAVDTNFNAYVTGSAFPTFPATPGAYQPNIPSPLGFYSGFVAKLRSSASVVYATFLGGTTGSTQGRDVAIGAAGAAYVAGSTSSTDFPGVPPLNPDPTAGFLSKLTPQGNGLQYTVRLGASINGVSVRKPQYARESRCLRRFTQRATDTQASL